MTCERRASIVVAGDTAPIGHCEIAFRDGDVTMLLGDLREEFEQADLRIINLECPLIRKQAPIEKSGPNMGAPVECVSGLKAMSVDIAGLANNHIMDHGPEGLRTTIRALEDHGIAHVGAGKNIDEAHNILVKEVNGIRIGVLAVAEHEFSIAGKNDPGANPFDVIDFVRNLSEHRQAFDCLIVLVHGGNENYPYPRPELREMCRFLVEQGASTVICQHSHCIGCMETYQGAPILYGQGNFLFDKPDQFSSWYEGTLLRLDISETAIAHQVIPFHLADDQAGTRRMTGAKLRDFMKVFEARSIAILEPGYVEREWEKFCLRNKRYYLHMLHGKPGLFRRVMGKLDLLHLLDPPEVLRTKLQMLRCESHREVAITVLSKVLKKHN